MKKKVTVGKIWGVIYPMFLYLGITYLVMFLAIMAITVVYIIQTGQTNQEIIYNNVISSLQNQTMLLTLCSACSTIPILVYFRRNDIRTEKLNGRYKKYKVNIFKYLLIIPFAIFCMLSANYFVSILTMIMPDSMTDTYASTEQAIYGSGLGIQILAAAIAGPIVEELIFRGLVYDRIKRMSSVIPGAIISALAFGIFHGNWVQAPYAFIIGLVCVFVYEKYKNIAAPIILHMTVNTASVIISFAAKNVTNTNTTDVSNVTTVIICFLMVAVTGVFAAALGICIDKFVKAKNLIMD